MVGVKVARDVVTLVLKVRWLILSGAADWFDMAIVAQTAYSVPMPRFVHVAWDLDQRQISCSPTSYGGGARGGGRLGVRLAWNR